MSFGTAGNPQVNDLRLVTGTATAVQFPDVPVLQVKFKAHSTNIGSFMLGETPNDLYWELDAGQETEWTPLANMNQLYYKNVSGSSDYLAYWIER